MISCLYCAVRAFIQLSIPGMSMRLLVYVRVSVICCVSFIILAACLVDYLFNMRVHCQSRDSGLDSGLSRPHFECVSLHGSVDEFAVTQIYCSSIPS